jgi:hypothetical protein
MKTRILLYPFITAVLSSYSGLSMAQDTDLDLVDDPTLIVVDEDADPETAMEPIVLPDDASAQAVESSAQGLATANQARERGREFGQDTAEAARERGAEARESAADRASEARERAVEARERGADARSNAPAGRP